MPGAAPPLVVPPLDLDLETLVTETDHRAAVDALLRRMAEEESSRHDVLGQRAFCEVLPRDHELVAAERSNAHAIGIGSFGVELNFTAHGSGGNEDTAVDAASSEKEIVVTPDSDKAAP